MYAKTLLLSLLGALLVLAPALGEGDALLDAINTDTLVEMPDAVDASVGRSLTQHEDEEVVPDDGEDEDEEMDEEDVAEIAADEADEDEDDGDDAALDHSEDDGGDHRKGGGKGRGGKHGGGKGMRRHHCRYTGCHHLERHSCIKYKCHHRTGRCYPRGRKHCFSFNKCKPKKCWRGKCIYDFRNFVRCRQTHFFGRYKCKVNKCIPWLGKCKWVPKRGCHHGHRGHKKNKKDKDH